MDYVKSPTDKEIPNGIRREMQNLKDENIIGLLNINNILYKKTSYSGIYMDIWLLATYRDTSITEAERK